MLKMPISLWIWCLFKFSIAFPIPPSCIYPVAENWTANSNNIIAQEDELPYYILEDAEREKRDSEPDDLGLETVSFEVPTVLRMNESKMTADGLPPDRKIHQALSLEAALGSGGYGSSFLGKPQRRDDLHLPGEHRETLDFKIFPDSASLISPERRSEVLSMAVNSCLTTKKPISLTIVLENVIPPGKADRYIITNSSEIKGCGALLKVNFHELKSTTTCEGEAEYFNHNSIHERKLDRIESKSRKDSERNKVEDDDEDDDELVEQKTIQDVLRKILSAGSVSSITPSTEREPGTERSSLTSPKIPEYDHNLLKLLEQLSSHLPKDKLLTLLTSLITRVSDAHR